MDKIRCEWCVNSELEMQYHDTEWGVPLHDDRKLFEFMVLDAFQAGLSWKTILNKRENFRVAFDSFDPVIISAYKQDKIESLMQEVGIIRNRSKIQTTVTNAQLFLEIQSKYGTFDAFIWQFTGGKTIQNSIENMSDVKATSPESDAMSKELKRLGFKFVGSTICYAFMQAAGMVNDHKKTCFRYNELNP
ncbi:MAG: DNA-3-methyladenine glycosylase I [Ignavibacteriae bacterium HGW-Ignavibacteriae-1]|nr:MAG: DNA-3-methyladenine glycosylase I [Ignavibacteriae bacterium HGW-Ignavibacteriae-1]